MAYDQLLSLDLALKEAGPGRQLVEFFACHVARHACFPLRCKATTPLRRNPINHPEKSGTHASLPLSRLSQWSCCAAVPPVLAKPRFSRASAFAGRSRRKSLQLQGLKVQPPRGAWPAASRKKQAAGESVAGEDGIVSGI